MGGQGHGARQSENQQGKADEDRHGEADPPILPVEQEENTRDDEEVTEDPDAELREKVRQEAGILVESLDHFPGCVQLVKGHIEVQTVTEQVLLEGVRGGPGHVLSGISGGDRHGLLQDGGDDEPHGCQDEDPLRSARAAVSIKKRMIWGLTS